MEKTKEYAEKHYAKTTTVKQVEWGVGNKLLESWLGPIKCVLGRLGKALLIPRSFGRFILVIEVHFLQQEPHSDDRSHGCHGCAI
jgi:hypothetical protein